MSEPNNDNRPIEEPVDRLFPSNSTLNRSHYTVLGLIGIFIISAVIFSFTSQLKFISVTLTLIILFKVYYDEIIVPYKPSTDIIPNAFIVTQIGWEFSMGFFYTTNYTRDAGLLVVLDHAKFRNVLWFLVYRLILFFRYRTLASYELVDVKGLIFLSGTGSLAAMLPTLIVTSYNIETTRLNCLIFMTTVLTDVATLFIGQLLYITRCATQLLLSSEPTVSGWQRELPFIDASFWSIFVTVFLLLFRVAPATVNANLKNHSHCKYNAFVAAHLADAEHVIVTICRIAMLLLLRSYVMRQLTNVTQQTDRPIEASYGSTEA